jgi:hypothetical protein
LDVCPALNSAKWAALEVLVNLKSPLTSRAARGRFVPIPTLEVAGFTKRLAVPTSRFEARWRLEVTDPVRETLPATCRSFPTITLAVVTRPVVALRRSTV